MVLSIIIAAYNVEAFIEKCILSVSKQSLLPKFYEILVINDGSTDNTLTLLNELQKKVSNLRIISQENSGLGASRNTGLQYSLGDYLWFIDGDDYIEENCLDGMVGILSEEQLDVLVLNYTVVDSSYKILSSDVKPFANGNKILSGSDFYSLNYSKNYTWLFIFNKKLFTENGISFKERINMQDSEILPKLMFYAKKISFFDKNSYFYVQQENSFTNSINGLKRYKYFESIIEVRNSLNTFRNEIILKDAILAQTILLKMDSLHTVVFNHLIYFRYERKWLTDIIQLLRTNEFYPLKYNANGKIKYVKMGMNSNPFITKKVIDYLRK